MNYKQAKSLKEKIINGQPIENDMNWDDVERENEKCEDEIEMECFKAGTHTDAIGNVETYTEEDINSIAKKYNEQKTTRPAPLIVGHSSMEAGKDDKAPAFGWADEAIAKGKSLYIKFKQIPSEMMELIKNGAYRNRSISLYEDGRIRHVALLGAAQPALELKPISFSEDGIKYKTYEYKESDMSEELKVTENVDELKKELGFFHKLFNLFKVDVKEYKEMENQVAREQGKPASDKAVTGTTEAQVAKENTEAAVPDAKIEVSKEAQADVKNEANDMAKELTELKGMVSTLEAQVKTLSEALKAKSVEAQASGNKEFCEQLVRDGKLRPADVENVLKTFEEKTYIDSVRNYAEQGMPSSVESYKLFLTSQPKIVEFEENIVPFDRQVAVPSFAELIDKKMKEKECDYSQAFKEVCEENPENEEVKSCYAYAQSVRK